jgi:predicted DNA-binding transcriptional regulator AlpA
MSERASIVGRGLRREKAAAYVGVSAGLFDAMVREGDLPRPRLLGGGRVKVWDRADLDAAIEAAPVDGEDTANEWDKPL